MRRGMRRFTRLTNGFSKKLENHGHMVALYFMHYNTLSMVCHDTPELRFRMAVVPRTA